MSVAGFKLTLWIPVEQVGIVIGRSGQTINKIQGGTSSRLNVVPDQDASAWAPVYIRGAPDGVFAAAQQVVELVDEVDGVELSPGLLRHLRGRAAEDVGGGGALGRSLSRLR